MRAGIQMHIEGLGVQRVPDKLARAGVELVAVRAIGRNALILTVRRKDREKVFAILRDSCYNIKKHRPVGIWRAAQCLRARAGLLVGFVLAAALIGFAGTRVLRIDVVGSGAYYRTEVLRLLEEEGVTQFSAPPSAGAVLCARIFALPHVTFCALHHEGGVLTVEIQTGEDAAPLSEEWLYAPADGVIEELTVLRGTPLVKEGDSVRAGDLVVSGEENGRRVLVMARLRIRFAVSAYFSGTREGALAQAYLEYGAMQDIAAQEAEDGWLITGQAFASCGVNL